MFTKMLRDARGDRSQGEVAAELGVSQASVSSWESGATIPRKRRLKSIARVYSVPLAKLTAAWLRSEPVEEEAA